MALAAAALLVSGMVGVLAFAGSASATGPALTVTPNTGLSGGQSVTVAGTGYPASNIGGILECSSDSSQPTIAYAGNNIPVSCSTATAHLASTNASGAMSASFPIIQGVVGPPATGTDSTGGSAATDAQAYPCPPTAAQVSAGVTCEIQYGTSDGTAAPPVAISFSGGSGTTTTTTSGGGGTTTTTIAPTTTTTTHATTTTTTAPNATTTTTAPCNGVAKTVAGPPSMTVTPATCVNGGTKVAVTGSGFDKSSPGNILECNSDPNQPTVNDGALAGNVPVSCNAPSIGALVTTDASGGLSGSFTIIAGTVGPPCGAAADLAPTCASPDSTGGDPTADAAKYPCPPTPAQVAAGDTCQLSFGDAGNETQTVPITFVPVVTPGSGSSTTTTAAGGAAATSAATTAAATAAKAPTATATSLAFTGAGPGTWYTLLGGLLLLDLGFLILTLYYRPREMASMFSRGLHKTFGGK